MNILFLFLLYIRRNIPAIPRSQPEMNWLAMARTSLGVKGISKPEGMAEPVFKMFRTVW